MHVYVQMGKQIYVYVNMWKYVYKGEPWVIVLYKYVQSVSQTSPAWFFLISVNIFD